MILNKEEYNTLGESFKVGGLHYYEVPDKDDFKRSLYGDDYQFYFDFNDVKNYGANTEEIWEDLMIEHGRIPTYKEFTDRVVEQVKTNDWSKKNNIQWNKAKEDVVRLRVAWYYRSHVLEIFTITQLHHKFPDCHVWTDNVIDRVFGVDIIFEDKKTGVNYYIHITQDGNDIMDKQDRGWCKNADGKWFKFKRDFSRDKGHFPLLYGVRNCKKNVMLGSQPIFRIKFLVGEIENMRAEVADSFDDSVTPKELSRFQKFVEENNIV